MHLLQIWIRPDAERARAGLRAEAFSAADKRGRLRLMPRGDGAQGAVRIHQDARVYAGLFDQAERADVSVPQGRRAWVARARAGKPSLNETRRARAMGPALAGPRV